MVPTESKRCTKCGEVKPLADFSKCSFNPRYKNQNRLRSSCKACCVRAAVRHQQKNPARTRANRQRWALANPEKVLECSARYWKANKAKHAALGHRRRALQRGSGGSFTVADIKRIYKAQMGLCLYCTRALNGVYHIDHKTPVSRGGSNDPKNLCCACPRCNRRKSARTALEFMYILEREWRTA
jgi:hypothetical protein